MLSQKSEALGDRIIRRKEVVNAIHLNTQDILKIGTISNDVVNSAIRPLRREEIYGRKVGKEANEKLRRKTRDRCHFAECQAWDRAGGRGYNESLSKFESRSRLDS